MPGGPPQGGACLSSTGDRIASRAAAASLTGGSGVSARPGRGRPAAGRMTSATRLGFDTALPALGDDWPIVTTSREDNRPDSHHQPDRRRRAAEDWFLATRNRGQVKHELPFGWAVARRRLGRLPSDPFRPHGIGRTAVKLWCRTAFTLESDRRGAGFLAAVV